MQMKNLKIANLLTEFLLWINLQGTTSMSSRFCEITTIGAGVGVATSTIDFFIVFKRVLNVLVSLQNHNVAACATTSLNACTWRQENIINHYNVEELN